MTISQSCPALFAVSVSVALLGSGCGGPSSEAAGGGPGGEERPPAPVRVEPVVRREVRPQVVVVGSVTARRTSVVASGAEGKVDEFLVRQGDVVEADQTLAVLNMVTTNLEIAEAEELLAEREQEYQELLAGSRPEEIAKARAEMEAARVARDVAATRLERMERLDARGAAIQDDLDDARERAQGAQKMFESAEAAWQLVEAGPRQEQIARARARRDAQQQHVDFLKAEREKRTIRSPFPGVIVEEHTERGQWLSKGDPVVTVADLLEEVHIVANVDQSELPHARLGQTVQVKIDAAAQQEWEGTVISIVPRSDWESGSRSFPVEVSVQNRVVEDSDGRMVPLLTEGMLARVRFVGPPRDAVLVPKDAIIRSEAGSRVFAVVPGEQPGVGKARPVTIVEGAAFERHVELVSGELQPGTDVIVEGAERLQPFADVRIQSDAAGDGAPPSTRDESEGSQ